MIVKHHRNTFSVIGDSQQANSECRNRNGPKLDRQVFPRKSVLEEMLRQLVILG